MCELFGVSSKYPIKCNEYLRDFFSHSPNHPHGWGLAILDGEDAQIEKEPKQADKSDYLRERMTAEISGKTVLAHIRYATIGNVTYNNCHPFTGKDITGRRWTLIHNGTIFDYPKLHKYLRMQNGETDSERVFLYILDSINKAVIENDALDDESQFNLLNELVTNMAEGNKLNLLFYDGKYTYVHTNQMNTLYMSKNADCIKFTTNPFNDDEWESVPMNTLLAYKDGKPEFIGMQHKNVYEENPENTQRLYQIFSDL
ncbi:class II glutamine amidotransferase [Howardella ureilytica]